MVKALADRLAEAFAEWLHERARREWYAPDEQLSDDDLRRRALPRHPAGVRLPGLPGPHREAASSSTCSAPRQAGFELTESFATLPGASVSGLYLAHPAGPLLLGRPDRPDQVADYAARRGIAVDEAERWLGQNLRLRDGAAR